MIFSKIFLFLRRHILLGAMLGIALTTTSCALVGASVNTAIALLPLKLMFKCLPEGTEIDTPNGPQTVDSLRPGDLVIGFDGSPVKVLQIQGYMEEPEVDDFLKVEFEDGAIVDLCRQHRIHGIRAMKLSVGQRLPSGHVVKQIASYKGVERSYDILTEDKGYRIGGVPVNSMINEMYEAGHNGGQMKP